jgi:hypothetical protein
MLPLPMKELAVYQSSLTRVKKSLLRVQENFKRPLKHKEVRLECEERRTNITKTSLVLLGKNVFKNCDGWTR